MQDVTFIINLHPSFPVHNFAAMADVHDKITRSYSMSRIKATNTKPEVLAGCIATIIACFRQLADPLGFGNSVQLFLSSSFTTISNMKKYIVVIIGLACIAPTFAQQGYLDKIADSACKCFDTVKDKIKNGDDFDREAESCISTAMMPYLDSISKDENIAIIDLDTEVGAKIGQKIGVKLAGTCPVFMKLITDYALDKDAGDVVTGTSTGLVAAVQLSGHLYLDIKESSGKIIKVLWLQNFPGADAYKSNPSSLKGKRITVEWKQEEIYFIAKKDFAIVRVITKLSVK